MRRYFISDPDQPRVRRAADAVLVVFGLSLLVWTVITSDVVTSMESALIAVTTLFPAWFSGLYKMVFVLGALAILALFIGAIALGNRLGLVRDLALTLLATFVLTLLLAWWIDGSLPAIGPTLSPEAEPPFPVLYAALFTSAVAVTAPHLARSVRLFLWSMVATIAISAVGLGLGLPGAVLGGMGLGLVVAGSVLLSFGSPMGYPNIAIIGVALQDLGVDVHDLAVDPEQSWGVRRLSGRLEDGTTVEVKAYGRDAADAQWLTKAWRNLWYREAGQQFTLSRLEAAEHEALASYIAADAGVMVRPVVAVGVGGEDVALLVTSFNGVPLGGESLTAGILQSVWQQVDGLHRAGIAHGTLTLDAITLDGEQPVMGELSAASINASEERMDLDTVSLLFATAQVVGADVAVAAAVGGLGHERLIRTLPYLQLPGLRRAQKKRADNPKATMSDVREAVVAATDAELPDPAKLRRIRWQDLVMPALSLVAAYALLSLLSDIDFVAVWDVVRTAQWALILIGFVIGQFVFFPEATGMMYATGYELPLKPLTILQVSVKWIGLAVPSAAGRITMNTLFLRKYGVPPTIALTQGAIDGVSGFVVEAGILLVAFLASDIEPEFETNEINWALILFIVALLIIGGLIAVWRIKRLRDLVVPVIRDAWDLLWGVMKDPTRTLGLLGSNLASRFILAVTLWFILQAIDVPLSLVTCLVITVATNLLAGLVPIPGGIGVAEAVLTSFLVLAGLGVDEAFAAAVVFRIATFYIPAAEGFFALRWLRSGDYV